MSTNQPPIPGKPALAPPAPSKIQHSPQRFGPGAPAPPASPASPGSPGSPATPAPPASPAPTAPPGPPGDSPAFALPSQGAELPVTGGSGPAGPGARIRTFEKGKRHEEQWRRTPNATGQGAIHVKTFHCKLTEDALSYMDQLVNEWLDAHPEYEVKFVSSTIGILTGKLKEPALICQVWV